MIQRFGSIILTLLLLLRAGGVLHAEENASEGWQHRLFNEWEVAYSAGSPFGASEWRRVQNSQFYEKFTHMWQLNFCHQFSSTDYGAASVGYRYPSLGVYLQWLDWSRLSIQGVEPHFPADKRASYGQIASLGWTLHQYLWDRGNWRLHLDVENGAAYVFRPHFESGNWVTLAQHWQIFINLGLFLDRAWGRHEMALGAQMTHMSNSGLGSYNTGINSFSLSLRYRQKAVADVQRCRPEEALLERDGTPFRTHLYGSVVSSLGGVYYEHSEHPNGQLCTAADAMWRINPTNGLGLGLDYYHNAQPDRTGHTEYVGAGVKYDRWIGPFILHIQSGLYMGNRRPIKWKDLARSYQVLGFKYLILPSRRISPYVGVYSKSNDFNAEMMSFGLGVMVR